MAKYQFKVHLKSTGLTLSQYNSFTFIINLPEVEKQGVGGQGMACKSNCGHWQHKAFLILLQRALWPDITIPEPESPGLQKLPDSFCYPACSEPAAAEWSRNTEEAAHISRGIFSYISRGIFPGCKTNVQQPALKVFLKESCYQKQLFFPLRHLQNFQYF